METEIVENSIRNKILKFEELIRKLPDAQDGDQKDCPLKHTFADGIYVREIFIPKGKVIVGKIHRHSHPNFLMSGEVLVVTESGGKEHLKAPLSMISPSSTKRVVYALTDVVWITVHNVGEERNLDKIEDRVIVKSFKMLEQEQNKIIESEVVK